MNERRATKRALLTSITALVMCVVMLAGTTFAWFTDTASTNVNKIQAGKLDVALEMQKADGTWENAEGKTLEFKKADAAPSGEKVLWEPGATYELPKLRVINNGNLNIKCRVEVTGIKKVTTAATPAGTFDLNDVITWTATGLDLDTNFILKSTDAAKEFTISGTMDTAAGNDYQGLTIDGVSITVYATQAEGEFDSTRNDYDKDATYTRTNATLISETDGKTVTLEAGKTYTVGTASITTDASGNITYKNNGTAQEVTINTDGHNLTVNAPNDTVYHYGKAGTVTVTAVAGSSYHEFGEVGVLALSKGRVVVEKGDAVKILQVKAANSAENPVVIAVPQNVVLDTKLEKNTDVSEIVIKTVDSDDKVVTETKITNGTATTTEGENQDADTPKELSKIIGTGENGSTSVGDAEDYVAMIGSTGYATLSDAVAAAKDGDTIKLLRDVSSDRINLEDESITVDLNGHTLTSTEAYGVMFCAKNGKTITVNGTTPGSKLVGTVMVTAKTDGHIVLNGGTYESDKYVPVYINGAVNTENSTLKIKDAVITAIGTESDQDSGWGVYLAGYATSTIENTKITAPVTGIEIRAGKLDLTNCTVTGGNGEVKEKADGSGTTVTNAAVVVSQHTTKKNIDVTIKDGEYTATAALYQSDVQGTGSQGVKATVLSGMFAGEVKAATEGAITINGGTFSSQPDSSYVATGYTATKGSNGVWTVAKSTQSTT